MNKEGYKTLILRLPEEKHKALKVLAASLGKNMTEVVLEWIGKFENEKDTTKSKR